METKTIVRKIVLRTVEDVLAEAGQNDKKEEPTGDDQ